MGSKKLSLFTVVLFSNVILQTLEGQLFANFYFKTWKHCFQESGRSSTGQQAEKGRWV